MNEFDRPGWCPDPRCLCLGSRAERICVGRLKKMIYDQQYEMQNTHSYCCLGLPRTYFNAADAWYDRELMWLAIRDVADNGLYAAEHGQIWDLGLTIKIKGEAQ